MAALARGFRVNGLDEKLRRLIRRAKGFHVELGANDGVAQPNTLLLELFFGWRGVVIGPVSSSSQELRRNRSARRNSLVQADCVGDGYESDTLEIVYSNLMSTVVGLGSDVADAFLHAESGGVFLSPDEPIRVETVPARTLTAVLDQVNAPLSIRLRSLDVAGVEREVLRGLDLPKYRSSWILVESRDIEPVAAYLAAEGFHSRAQLSSHDFCFESSPMQ